MMCRQMVEDTKPVVMHTDGYNSKTIFKVGVLFVDHLQSKTSVLVLRSDRHSTLIYCTIVVIFHR